MTKEEKRDVLIQYCAVTHCNECLLKNHDWKYPDNGECPMIEFSPDEDLDRALSLIGYEEKVDNVHSPAHYTDGKIEVIDFIEDKKLGFCLGNAIKYISRAGKKDPTKEIEDLKKAAWYINRRIKELEEKIC